MIIANQEPFRRDMPGQEWPESRTLKQGLLGLRLIIRSNWT